jgi:hypothetical protein
MNSKNIVLTCTSVRYYSRKDEDAFFEWIKKIDCIEDIGGAGKELYLYIATNDLHEYDLRELLALFYRYKIDMKQLQIFLNKNNKIWFCDNKKAYWHRCVFGVGNKNE